MKRLIIFIVALLSIFIFTRQINAIDMYGDQLTSDQIEKMIGSTDYIGITKAIEDIKSNYEIYNEKLAYNNDDDYITAHCNDSTIWNSISYGKYALTNFDFYFSKNNNYPTFMFAYSPAYLYVYACYGDSFKKFIFDNGMLVSISNPAHIEAYGAFLDDGFYISAKFNGSTTGMQSVGNENLILKYNGNDFIEVDKEYYVESYDYYNGETHSATNYDSHFSTDYDSQIIGEHGISKPDYCLEYDYKNFHPKFKKFSIDYSGPSFYESNDFFNNISKDEYNKMTFLLASNLGNKGAVNDTIIGDWVAERSNLLLPDEASASILTGNYKNVWDDFNGNYILYAEEKRFSIDILNNYTESFFNKKISPGEYGEYGHLSVDKNSFNCQFNMCMVGIRRDFSNFALTDIDSKYNYAIIGGAGFNYGTNISIYGLFEKIKEGDEYKLYPLYFSKEPYSFEEAEAKLGYRLIPDFLDGFDQAIAANKTTASDIINYIQSSLSKNGYIQGDDIPNDQKDILFKCFTDFENKYSSYKLNSSLEFNDDFYNQLSTKSDEISKLKVYLESLGLKFNPDRKTYINLLMEKNNDEKYIFSFDQELSDKSLTYNIFLKDLGINLSLSSDDIDILSKDKTVFAIERIDDMLFVSPLSKKRTSLPVNIKINIGRVFNGSYLNSYPILYYIDNTNHDVYVFMNHYGPIEFKSYSANNLNNIELNKFTKISYNNILSANILSENSENLNLDEPLTKGELARVCGFILGDLENDDSILVPDVNEADKIYIRTAIKNGIFSYDGGNFSPGEPVKRSTLIYTLTECLRKKGINLKDADLGLAANLSDYERFNWMKENVQIALEQGILSHETTSLNPDVTSKREHAIITIYRTLRALSQNGSDKKPSDNFAFINTEIKNKISKTKKSEYEKLKAYDFTDEKSISNYLSSVFENKLILLMLIIIALLLIIILILLFIRSRSKKATKLQDSPKTCKVCGKEYTNEKFCTGCGNNLK